jgi:hypothetical protein
MHLRNQVNKTPFILSIIFWKLCFVLKVRIIFVFVADMSYAYLKRGYTQKRVVAVVPVSCSILCWSWNLIWSDHLNPPEECNTFSYLLTFWLTFCAPAEEAQNTTYEIMDHRIKSCFSLLIGSYRPKLGFATFAWRFSVFTTSIYFFNTIFTFSTPGFPQPPEGWRCFHIKSARIHILRVTI